jgi:hypothetical protein
MDLSADAWVVGAASLEELSGEIDRLIKGLEAGLPRLSCPPEKKRPAGNPVRIRRRDFSEAAKALLVKEAS